MKRNKLLPLCFIVTAILSLGCKKECRNVSLPSIECGDGFDKDNSYKYYEFKDDPLNIQTNQIILVTNDSIYKALFSTASQDEFGKIDFTKNMLIGTCTVTNMASSYKSQGFLCKKRIQDKWKYTVQYSLKDQCKGSGIDKLYLSAWLLGPKLPVGANIELDLKDVNPI